MSKVIIAEEPKQTTKQLVTRLHELRAHVEELELYCSHHFTHYYGIMTLHRLMLEDLELHIKKCPTRGT